MSRVTCQVSHVTCLVSCVTCHVSHVTCHMSRVTCHVSHVTCHMSRATCHFFFFFFFWTKRWSLSVEGLLSTGPTPSSFIRSGIFSLKIFNIPWLKKTNKKNIRVRDLTLWDNNHHPLCVMCPMSHVMCQVYWVDSLTLELPQWSSVKGSIRIMATYNIVFIKRLLFRFLKPDKVHKRVIQTVRLSDYEPSYDHFSCFLLARSRLHCTIPKYNNLHIWGCAPMMSAKNGSLKTPPPSTP